MVSRLRGFQRRVCLFVHHFLKSAAKVLHFSAISKFYVDRDVDRFLYSLDNQLIPESHHTALFIVRKHILQSLDEAATTNALTFCRTLCRGVWIMHRCKTKERKRMINKPAERCRHTIVERDGTFIRYQLQHLKQISLRAAPFQANAIFLCPENTTYRIRHLNKNLTFLLTSQEQLLVCTPDVGVNSCFRFFLL